MVDFEPVLGGAHWRPLHSVPCSFRTVNGCSVRWSLPRKIAWNTWRNRTMPFAWSKQSDMYVGVQV